MAVILITGAKGQLGNELKVASKNHFGHDFIYTDVDNLDLTDGDKLGDFIRKVNPGWIINCAAYTQVDKAEEDYDNALMINALAVRNIVSVIRDSSCRFIHISTDFVFNGNATTPYREFDVPDPVSAYGRSKREGEIFALQHPHTMVIRTSWLYSPFGHNFVKTMLKLAKEKDSLRVVDDQEGCPTYALDLAHAILHIIAGVNNHQIAFNAGIYHYSNEGSCTWYEFATAILEEAALGTPVIPIKTADLPTAARRPAYSVMSKAKITENYRLAIPHWKTSLAKCIKIMSNS